MIKDIIFILWGESRKEPFGPTRRLSRFAPAFHQPTERNNQGVRNQDLFLGTAGSKNTQRSDVLTISRVKVGVTSRNGKNRTLREVAGPRKVSGWSTP